MNTIQQLLRADTEAEVLSAINSNAEMRNPENWHAVDNRDTNFNTISNQSRTGGKAATELITNMVDAVLTKCCLEEGIDPKSKDAPQTMYKAVDKFVRPLNGGKIIKADDAWLRSYSSANLVIGVTGSRTKKTCPCYTFCDNGEGQPPDKFQNTFLSLRAKNKSEIPFVQGKYNMGSSGVLGFCGRNWFKLIVSRRYDGQTPWGWTLIRKREAKGLPYAEYFAPSGKVPTFDDSELFPFVIGAKKRFDGFSLKTGTIIKLYEYYAGKGQGGFRAAREVFNENLVETILPFRIYDFRQTPNKTRGGLRALGIDERSLYGLDFLLRRTHQESAENESDGNSSHDDYEPIHVGTENHHQLGKIIITAIPLKEESGKKGWFKESGSRVFHHVNGQVQLKKTKGYLTQCGLPALKDRVVIFVDSSNLEESAHHDVWKGDRETIRESQTGELYEYTIKQIIKNSEELKKLNHRIAQEILDSATKDGSRDILNELVKRDKNFSLLLDGQIPEGVSIGTGTTAIPNPRSDLKYDPTYIKVKGRKIELSLPINHSRPIACETNADDNFFMRPDNCGLLLFSNDDVVEKIDYNHKLSNGELVVFVRPIRGAAKVGDKFKFKLGLNSESMPVPVFTERTITIAITEKIKRKQPLPPHDPLPRPSRQAGFPPYILLTKNGKEIVGESTKSWSDCDAFSCTEQDGGYVHDLGEEKMYYINCDNASFTSYLSSIKLEERASASKKYIMSMRILLLGLEHALSSHEGEQKDEDDYDDRFRRMAAKGAASVAMTVCDHLPKVFELDKNPATDE